MQLNSEATCSGSNGSKNALTASLAASHGVSALTEAELAANDMAANTHDAIDFISLTIQRPVRQHDRPRSLLTLAARDQASKQYPERAKPEQIRDNHSEGPAVTKLPPHWRLREAE